MTKSLVTGASGFVAYHLIKLLLEKGEDVYASVRWNEDLSRIEPLKDKIKMIPMDLIDLGSCIRALQESNPDYVFHLAAQSFVPDSFAYPYQTIMTNTLGTLNLLEALRILKDSIDPVVHICSSSEVYGQINEDEVPVDESQPFRPQNPYGVGKLGADAIASVYYKCYGIKTIRTRMFTHTGWGRTMESAEVSFARQIALIEAGKQEPIVYVGNLDSVRTIADVRDAVRAYYILVRKCQPGEVYNIGGDRTMKIGDVLNYLISLSTMKDKIKIQIDPKKLRPADVTLQIPCVDKFKNETGWKPEIRFEETALSLLEFWRRKISG